MSTHLTPASAVVFNESSAALNFIMINRDQFTIREFMALIHIETNTSQNLLAAIYSEAADRSRSKVIIEIEAKLKKKEAQRRLDAERLKIKKGLILSYSNPIASGSPAAFPVPAMGSVTTPGGSTTVPNYSFNSHLLNPVSSPFVPTVNPASTVWGSKNNSTYNTPAGSNAASPVPGSTPAVPAAPGSAAFKTEWDEMKSIVL